jgi:hypothetical protein
MKKLTSSGSRPFWFGLLTLSLTSAGLLPGTAFAQKYQETNLVSNTSQSGVTTVDPDLVDCWGISRSSTGPWWVSDRGKGVATLYNGTGAKQTLTVTIPQSGQNATGAPTGIVFNGSTDFDVESGKPQASTDFGTFSHSIIVGQFGSGEILAFNSVTGEFQGELEDQNADAISIPGLWGLSFGAGNANSGAPNQLFFNAGIDQGQAGLFGFFAPVTADLTQGNDQ